MIRKDSGLSEQWSRPTTISTKAILLVSGLTQKQIIKTIWYICSSENEIQKKSTFKYQLHCPGVSKIFPMQQEGDPRARVLKKNQ